MQRDHNGDRCLNYLILHLPQKYLDYGNLLECVTA